MTIWLAIGILTVCSLGFVLWPMIRRAKTDQIVDRSFDTEVYRDQLAELERDAERGLIDEKEKEAARNEVSRRLLKANAAAKEQSKGLTGDKKPNFAVVFSSVVAVCAIAGGLYFYVGHPAMPDMPQEKRIAQAAKNKDMPALIFQLQRYLEKTPNDIKGWKVLAPALKRSNRFAEAADAYLKVMQLESPKPKTLIDFAESALLANNGKSNQQIQKAVDAALQMDNNFAQARFYKAMILQQQGKSDEALKQWRTLLAQNPKNLQLQMAVQRQIAALKSSVQEKGVKLPSLDKEQRQAAANMTPKERQQMIAGMVARLANRVKENGDNLNDWLKLIRVRKVMGDTIKAQQDLDSARKQFKDNTQSLARLDKQARELGLK